MAARTSASPCLRPGLIAGLGLCAWSCAPDPIEAPAIAFEARYATDRLRVGSAFDADLCAGSLRLMDDHLAWLDGALRVPQTEPVWLKLYASDQTILECELGEISGASGCWIGRAAYAKWDVAASHELVHARAAALNPDPLDFFSEGLAVRMQGTVMVGHEFFRRKIEDYLPMTSGELAAIPDSYATAGHFMHWSIERYGIDRVLELYANSRGEMSAGELAALFKETLGEDMTDIFALYATSAKEFYPGVGPYVCGGGEPVTLAGHDLHLSGELDCADMTTTNRYDTAASPEWWRRWRLELAESGTYHVKTWRGKGNLTRCMSGPAEFAELQPSDSPVLDDWAETEFPLARPPQIGFLDATLQLEAGVYDLWIGQSSDLPLHIYTLDIMKL